MSGSIAIIGLGSNIGSREALLLAAARLMTRLGGVAARSRLYVTPPLGPPQPDFLNAAVSIQTELDPFALLEGLREIERTLGRVRRQRWGPRTVDLDVLWTSSGAIATDALTIPHPELRSRAFALAPLLDVRRELEKEYGPDLAKAGAPPPTREWCRTLLGERTGADPIDALDALALAHTSWLIGDPISEPRAIEAKDAPSFAEAASGAVAAVVFEVEPGSTRGLVWGPK